MSLYYLIKDIETIAPKTNSAKETEEEEKFPTKTMEIDLNPTRTRGVPGKRRRAKK